MSIILTGDVHHRIGSGDQHFVARSEAALAQEYARVTSNFDIKATLFFTGRAVSEDGADAQALISMESVEIGGHGWDALRPRWWHRLMKLVTGSPHGPMWMQRRMVQRTCVTIERYTGRPLRCWRNHAYRYDRHTPALLAAAGITVWSDEVQLDRLGPRLHSSGIAILPVNTLPDHEHLYHGLLTPELAATTGRDSTYSPRAWCAQVCAQVERIVDAGGIATVLAHPICMKVADDFATLERLCDSLSRFRSLFASEATRACVY